MIAHNYSCPSAKPDIVPTSRSLADRAADQSHPEPDMVLASPPVEFAYGALATASKMLAMQAMALQNIAEAYSEGGSSEQQLLEALDLMHNRLLSGGKVVLTGMGKSYKIAEKLTATMCSLGITAVSLHAADAFHGDLGIVRSRDVLLMISNSGTSPELIALLPHLPTGLAQIIISGNSSSPLAAVSHAVLHVPIPEECQEVNVYGLAAPTISTTAAMAVGDAVCVTLHEMLEGNIKARQASFGKVHPGGAIGQVYKASSGT